MTHKILNMNFLIELERLLSKKVPAAAFVAFVLLLAFVPFALREAWPFYQQSRIFQETPREDYLASLANNRTLGCVTAPILEPEILVYGDSHTYANIDYVKLGEAWGMKRIGNCTLPGGYIWSFNALAEFLDRYFWKPKTIVYMTNFRQFRRSSSREAMLESHAKILTNPNLRSNLRRQWVSSYEKGKPPFGKTYKDMQILESKHQSKIEALSPDLITKTIKANSDRYLEVWRKNIERFSLSPTAPQSIAQMCSWIEAKGIDFYVIHTPDSGFLEDEYDPEKFQSYLKLVNSIGCAKSILIGSRKAWNIDERHFVNRQLYSRLDYSKFDGKKHSDIPKWNVYFDADHMNPFGADILTQKMIDAFPELRK